VDKGEGPLNDMASRGQERKRRVCRKPQCIKTCKWKRGEFRRKKTSRTEWRRRKRKLEQANANMEEDNGKTRKKQIIAWNGGNLRNKENKGDRPAFKGGKTVTQGNSKRSKSGKKRNLMNTACRTGGSIEQAQEENTDLNSILGKGERASLKSYRKFRGCQGGRKKRGKESLEAGKERWMRVSASNKGGDGRNEGILPEWRNT